MSETDYPLVWFGQDQRRMSQSGYRRTESDQGWSVFAFRASGAKKKQQK
jgi:hypothetical protein